MTHCKCFWLCHLGCFIIFLDGGDKIIWEGKRRKSSGVAVDPVRFSGFGQFRCHKKPPFIHNDEGSVQRLHFHSPLLLGFLAHVRLCRRRFIFGRDPVLARHFIFIGLSHPVDHRGTQHPQIGSLFGPPRQTWPTCRADQDQRRTHVDGFHFLGTDHHGRYDLGAVQRCVHGGGAGLGRQMHCRIAFG